jgi:hypothetical protein
MKTLAVLERLKNGLYATLTRFDMPNHTPNPECRHMALALDFNLASGLENDEWSHQITTAHALDLKSIIYSISIEKAGSLLGE